MKGLLIPLFAIAVWSMAGLLPAAEPAELVKASGVQGGLVVHLGCGDGQRTMKLRVNERYLVHGLDADADSVEKARAAIRAAGCYGPVSIARWTDASLLPYADNLVNLIVIEEGAYKGTDQELLRVLVPRGVALFPNRKLEKPWPAAIDEWTHFLHGPDNNAVGKDRVAAEPRSLQWASAPRWGRSHEEAASMSAAVTANGRLFSIVDQAPLASIRFQAQWELVGQDAFNGTILWKKPISLWSDQLRHFRAGPVHLPRRLVAVGDTVYVTMGLDAPVTALDAATGDVRHVYQGSERTEEILVADGVLYLAVGTSEIERTGGGLFARDEPEPSSFRFITALKADTGAPLWKKEFTRQEQLLPLSLTVENARVFYQSTHAVGALDAKSGQELWKTPRQTVARRMAFSSPTVVAAGDVLLVADRVPSAKDPASNGAVVWGVNGWNEAGFERKPACELKAYAVNDGKELWSAPCNEDYNADVDVFVVGQRVFVGAEYQEYDLKTGRKKTAIAWKGAAVGMPHPRCYRNKATEKYIFTGRAGVELVDLDKGWVGNNSWVRGTCQYGILPANGLVYAPPNACACFAKVKVQGYVAVAPQREESPKMTFSSAPALETGAPAQNEPAGAEDWPMYRRDAERSGASTAKIADAPKRKWTADLGGALTQALAVGDRVFVASTNTDTLFALNAADGTIAWQRTLGGRVDSAPTYWKGLLLTGSADGYVTALNAADGRQAWRFRAAPKEHLISSFGRLESSWPVHGSVLVQNDTLYVMAGRNSYLDGGMVLYRLDPLTGKELGRNVICDLDPETGRQTGKEPAGPFNMEGVGSDILSGDGTSVFMRQMRFDADGKENRTGAPHLFSMTGLLNEEWFVRTYWIFGTDTRTGWGGWADAAKSAPFGRILSFQKDRFWGYGRKTIASAATGHKADEYHLFCRMQSAAQQAPPEPEKKAARKKGAGEKESSAEMLWSVGASQSVRAMVLASDKLVIAGPPDLGQKDQKILAFLNAPEALSAFNGEKGALLQVVSAADGKTLSEQKLPVLPVFDGLSAAHGRLYISLRNGTVECWE